MFRFSVILSILCIACKTISPTPLLIKELTNANDKIHVLYEHCVSIPEKCDKPQLISIIKETQAKAKFFIGGDIKQPHGYDIYLQITAIYFSISEATKNELTEAELIARQFFEVQKASSGRGINDARYFWALFMLENLSHDFIRGVSKVSIERKTEILLCLSEALAASQTMEPGIKLARLQQIISLLSALNRNL